MKLLLVAGLLCSIVAAQKGKGGKGAKGGKGGGKSTENDLKGSSGPCKDIYFIMARASTEPGNMGASMGPIVCSGLKREFPNRVGCQGVGSPYSAGLADNASPKGTTQAAIGEAQKMFKLAASKCPKALIVFGGYSQGTAVMHNAVSGLPADIKAKVVGGVLFGDTRNKQDKGQVPKYPKENVQIFCDPKDGVCKGTLSVTGGHFVYMSNGDGPKAINFLKGKINAKLGKSGGASAADTMAGPPAAKSPKAPKAAKSPKAPKAPKAPAPKPAPTQEAAPAGDMGDMDMGGMDMGGHSHGH